MTDNRPAEGWSTDWQGFPVWTSHNKWADAPMLDGWRPWWIARHSDYVRYTYRRPAEVQA